VTNEERNLLAVLKAELEFVDKGGYRNTARAAWRPQFIFQDSPTCLNFDPTQPPRPCTDCLIRQVVPEADRRKKIPCRFIPLNEQGETIDSFYRYGKPEELDAALRRWLGATIERLEKAEHPERSGEIEVPIRAKAAEAE
jgi:hypothetical protein